MVALASAFVRIRPQVDRSEFKRAGEQAGDDAGKAAGESYGKGFTRGADGKLRDFNGRFVSDSEKVGDEAGKRTGRSFSAGIAKSSGPTGIFGRVLATLSAKYTLAGGAALAATPGILQFTAALAPVAGLAVELPAALAAGGAAMATFKVATAGVGDAIDKGLTGTAKQAEKALKDLPPAAKDFARSIISLKPQIDGLRASVAERFFRPFADDIRPLAEKYFPLLRAQMSNLAGPLGGLAEQLTETARRAQVYRAVATTFQQTRVAVINLRGAIDPLGKALAAVINSTAGKLPGLAQGFVDLTVRASAFIQQAAKSGAISRFFDAGLATAKNLIGVLVNVGSIIRSVFGAATANGADLLTTLKNLTGQAAAFLRSTQGAAALGSVFSTLAAFGQALRTSLGAVLPAIAQSVQILAPAIAALAQPFATLVVAAAPLLPIFAGTAATIITKLTPAIATLAGFLAQHTGVLKGVVAAYGAFIAVQRVSAALLAVQAAGSLLAYIKGLQIVTTLTNIGTAAQYAFGVALRFATGPIGLIITAITLLGAGLVLLYKKNETFRNFVNAAWASIKVAIAATVDWVVHTAWPALKAAWDGIAAGAIWLWRNVIQPAWSGIRTAVSASVEWITGTAWPALKATWNAIATGVNWLWHNVIQPAWSGIQAAIGVAVAVVKGYIAVLTAVFRGVSTVVEWLYRNIFAPVFAAIRKVVEIWWLSAQIVFAAFTISIKGLGAIAVWLWRNVFAPVFSAIGSLIEAWWARVRSTFSAIVSFIRTVLTGAIIVLRTVFQTVFAYIANNVVRPWWQIIQTIFGLFRQYVVGPLVGAMNYLRDLFTRIFNAIAGTVTAWWRAHVQPIFAAVRAGWNLLAQGFSDTYNGKIRPLFSAFIGFIRDKVVGGFNTGVALIKAAWDKVRDYARAPVEFVVNRVINPFIGGLNAAAGIVGVKDRVAPIKLGFRDGGQVGFRQGGKISGSGGISDNRQAMIPGVGAVQLRGGEFVVNPEMTAQTLPLLRWVNDGMKGGAQKIASYLGRPVAREPGDGSEGFAFRDGGLVGWAKDVWGAISNPAEAIKKPFESALSHIPGSGMVKDFLLGSARKLLTGALSWLGNIGGGVGGGSVSKAVDFLRKANGAPYGWANAGPDSWDCSGIVSSVYNILHGKNPYGHTFSTANAQDYFPKNGYGGALTAAWAHPGQRPASASVGHMMGRVGTLTFESTGSRGVHLGATTRRLSDFANVGHYRGGGLLNSPVKLFDAGGPWPSGTLGVNLSGRTEYVDPNRSGTAGGVTIIVQAGAFSGAIVANEKQAEDLVVGAINSAVRKRRITAATIKAKPA